MAVFSLADRFRIKVEGVFSNESTDRGGRTVFGLCERDFKDCIGIWKGVDAHEAAAGGDLAVLKARLKADLGLQGQVSQVFKRVFWDPFNLDELEDQFLAEEIYEQATNMSGRTSAQNLQEGLNLCNMKLIANEVVQLWPDLSTDGLVGPATHEALKACAAAGRLKALMDVINTLQGEDYINIARRNPKQRVYVPGWIGQRVHVGNAA